MLLNPTTQKWLKAFLNQPKAALLIDSPNDIETATKLLHLIHQELIQDLKSPLISVSLLENKKLIGIEQIRDVTRSLSTQADRAENQMITRVAAVIEAEKLSLDAQNSLLKIIEELPARTLLVFVAVDKKSILKTIQSRCFTLPVLPLEKSQALKYAKDNQIDSGIAEKAYLMSEGRSSLFLKLVHESENILEQSMLLAKEYLKSSIIERQKINEKLLKNPEDVDYFIASIELLCKIAMRNTSNIEKKIEWRNRLRSSHTVRTQLKSNVSPKLSLLNLTVSI